MLDTVKDGPKTKNPSRGIQEFWTVCPTNYVNRLYKSKKIGKFAMGATKSDRFPFRLVSMCVGRACDIPNK
jgi:hypothetical protein